MTAAQGGMGFTSLYDYVQKRKRNFVHSTLLLQMPAPLLMGGLLNRATRGGGATLISFHTSTPPFRHGVPPCAVLPKILTLV